MSTRSRSRGFTLAEQQPILEKARAPRRPRRTAPERAESEFWRSFNLEKFAADWRRGVGRRK
jgi:hypothetical protein